MDTNSTTEASPAAATADTNTTSVVTSSSEPSGTTTQPSADAVATTSTPTGAQTDAGSFAANPNARSATSQTTTTPPASPGDAQQAAPINWEKRYTDQTSYLGRLSREHAELRKYKEQWGDLNPQQVREQMQRQQTDAQQRALKPWHPQHPDFSRTEARLSSVRSYAAARGEILAEPSIDDATKGRLISNLASKYGITQEDAALYREHENHVQDFQQRMARDPESSIAEIVERRVQQAIQQYDSYRQASTATDQWLNDPQRSKLLEKHAEDVLWAMDASTPRRDVGLQLAQLKAENEALKSRLGGQREVVETAAAQQAALKKRSTVVRDAVTAPQAADPVAEAQKLGLQGSALLAHLRSQRSSASE